MLNVKEIHGRVEKLVFFAARKYSSDGHAMLATEELVAEGWLTFSKVLKDNPDVSEDSFIKLFKASLFNSMSSLMSTYRYSKKRGYSEDEGSRIKEEHFIDLSDMVELIGKDAIDEIFYDNYVSHIKSILTELNPEACQVFKNLIEPDTNVCKLAINQSKRKKHLQQLGMLVKGADTVRIHYAHIQKHLGISQDKMNKLLKIVRSTVLSVLDYDGREFAV